MPKSNKSSRRTPGPARRRRASTAGDHVYARPYGNPYVDPYAEHPPPGARRGDLHALARLFWWCHRNRVELAPPAAAALLLGTAVAIRKAETPAVGLVAGAAVAGLTWWAAPRKWDREAEVLFARTVATLASLWLIAAVLVGPTSPLMFWALILGTTAGAVPWYRHKLARPDEATSKLLAEWQEQWAAIRDRLGLSGSHVIEVKGDENFAEITLQLVKGVQTFADVQPLAERIAGAMGLPAKAIKVRDRRKVDASTATLVFSRVSAIDALISWAEVAKLAPSTVVKPVVLGRRETGEWKQVSALGHWMIVGTTRAGKSNELHALLAQITGAYDEDDPDGRANALVFFVDLKGGSVGGRWVDVIDWLATDLDEAVRVFESANGMIDARGANAPVGEGDGDQLVPTPERPAVFIVFDECAEGLGVTPGSPNQSIKTRITSLAESIARRGAAMNIYLVLAGQDGSLETYGTEKLRGCLTKRLCFRVAKADNAQYVMSNYTKLDVTGLEDGQFYYHERADDPVPLRGPFMTPEGDRALPQQIAKRNAKRRPVLDEATARGGGDAYATRHERLPEKFRKARTAADAPAVPAQRREDAQMKQQHEPGSAAARAAALEAEAGIGDGPPITPDDLRRVSAADGFDLAEDLKDTLDTFCALLAGAPVGGIQPSELYKTINVGRTWAHDRLKALQEAGLVERVDHGRYRAAPGKRARALREAVEAWEAGRKQFASA